ncbi:tRNA (adenosine(37)-N6)-dimethylallyltransferase MiaA [Janibacter sp. G56]|uniref:tRNA (adenosine(37)-N6)-dimethylallyltransferase MiaA n=1 Tax=Janibacter sp. G56 TaxID=3418717 RepID=UPI003D06BB4F
MPFASTGSLASPSTAPVVAVVGPTASGKSDLGLDLAEALGGEVVNADAMQLYRGMDIGTAKLPVAQRRGIAHHLLDVLDVTQEATVARYQAQAREAIDDILARGRRPILVGGSGLYVRAALDVLEIPPTDPEVRAAIEAREAAEGADVLRAELRERDPEAAVAIEPNNVRRIIRALEVIELTGRPFSATMPTRTFLRPTVMVGLQPDRALLYERIGQRVHEMVDAGLADEVWALDAAGLRQSRTAARALGYAEVLALPTGSRITPAVAEDIIVNTRRFARRQLAWFRPEPRVHWLDPHAPDLTARALDVIRAIDTAPR